MAGAPFNASAWLAGWLAQGGGFVAAPDRAFLVHIASGNATTLASMADALTIEQQEAIAAQIAANACAKGGE